MVRTAAVLFALCFVVQLRAQQDAGKVHRIVKDPPKEMQAAPAASAGTSAPNVPTLSKEDMEQMEFQYIGTFTEGPAHPACAEATGDERKACTAHQVLAEIRSHLEAEPPASLPPAASRVKVGFDVNQFGDVKAITVNYAGNDQMSEAVVAALYHLPKFLPATNNGVRAGSHCSFSYAPALLFRKTP